jgi:transposase
MAQAYSSDLRIRVINRLRSGKESHQEIADIFEIGVATLRRWIRLNKETGSLHCKVPTVTRPRKVNYKKAQKFIEKNPDKTLRTRLNSLTPKSSNTNLLLLINNRLAYEQKVIPERPYARAV